MFYFNDSTCPSEICSLPTHAPQPAGHACHGFFPPTAGCTATYYSGQRPVQSCSLIPGSNHCFKVPKPCCCFRLLWSMIPRGPHNIAVLLLTIRRALLIDSQNIAAHHRHLLVKLWVCQTTPFLYDMMPGLKHSQSSSQLCHVMPHRWHCRSSAALLNYSARFAKSCAGS